MNHPNSHSSVTARDPHVVEGDPVGTVVVTVSATDNDIGTNSEVQYGLSPTLLHPFTINSSTGFAEDLINLTQSLHQLNTIANCY